MLKNVECGKKMKSLSIVLFVLLLAAPCVAAYTNEQQTTLDGMRLSFQLGMAYEKASKGQNVAEFNTLVDQYNTWVRQNFGEDANLLVSKMNVAAVTPLSSLAYPKNLTGVGQKSPFNSSSELSKFGKGQVYDQIPNTEQAQHIAEANTADWVLNNF
jgi:hypothetical protein